MEKTEDIKIKVYWNRRDWVKVGGNIVTPDNGIQTIFFATDLPKFQKAKEYLQPKIVARICTNNLKPQDTVVKLTAEEHLEYCLQHKDDLPMNFIKEK